MAVAKPVKVRSLMSLHMEYGLTNRHYKGAMPDQHKERNFRIGLSALCSSDISEIDSRKVAFE